MSGLRAFHGDPKLKERILTELHPDYDPWEERSGIPRMMDYFLKSFNPKLGREQYARFIAAIPVGADFSDVPKLFVLKVLSDKNHGVLRLTKPGSLQHTAISNVIALLNDNCNDARLWQNAWEAARAAALDVEEKTGAASRAAAAATWAAFAAVTAWDTVRAAKAVAEAAGWVMILEKREVRAAANATVANVDALAAAVAAAWTAKAIARADAVAARVVTWDVDVAEEARAAAQTAHYSWMALTLSNLLNQAPLLPPKEPQHA